MLTFPVRRDCTACPLHASGCRSVGIGTRPSDYKVKGLPRALLVVGEAPGRQEDEAGAAFVGQSGAILHRLYLGVLQLHEYADVFVTNAVRCRPHDNATPTKGEVNKCRDHLVHDIRILQEKYQEVVILCVGAAACQSVWGTSLTEAFGKQGDRQTWGWAGTEDLRPCPVFVTFHPANILNKRNPSRVVVIRDHLRLLATYLKSGVLQYMDAPEYKVAPPVPDYKPTRLSLDVETYGAVAWEPEQTCFHPVRSLYWDRPKHLVHTAALTWRDPDGKPETAVFVVTKPKHWQAFLSHVKNLAPGGDLVGMNLKFDLMYLRASSPLFKLGVQPFKVNLVDLAVRNYQYSELRPERSLKSIAPLLAITKYEEATSLKRFRYRDSEDPELLKYNGIDTWATLLAVEELEARIKADYPGSDKLSPFANTWYTRLLWTCLLMEESGVAFDAEALDALDYELVLKSALLYSECRHKYGVILSGKGSGQSVQSLYERAAEEAGLLGDPRIEVTAKQKKISCNQKNAALLLEALGPGETSTKLRLQQEYEAYQKMVTTYTRPMMHGTAKNPVNSRLLIGQDGIGMSYPTWYPVPSVAESGTAGGTQQGRVTCKHPALQTFPKHSELGKRLSKCFRSRYKPGFLISVDLSQIELRVAALLSGDPVMIDEYVQGVDRHTKTAKLIIRKLLEYYPDRDAFEIKKVEVPRARLEYFLGEDPKVLKKLPDFEVWRQMGKTTNFLILFGGRGPKLRLSFLEDLGVELPLAVCDAVIFETMANYRVFKGWQDSLMQEALEYGRLEIPLTGQSRTFIGTKKVLEDTYRSEILNFKIQTTAANIMLDMQSACWEVLLTFRERVYMGLNVYDAAYLDGPMSMYAATRKIIPEVFGRSRYYDALCTLLERTVPLGYDVTVLQEDTLLKSQ